jgi:hypothetical protein
MRKSLTVLAAVPWLLMAPACITSGSAQTPPSPQPAPPSGGTAPQTINYVELIQLDPQTQVFKAQLVDVRAQKVALDVSGKGTQLQDFQQQSAKIAPRARTATFTGPLASTVDVIVRPPIPPGPTGDDRIKAAIQMAHLYDAILPVQSQAQPQPGSLPAPAPAH